MGNVCTRFIMVSDDIMRTDDVTMCPCLRQHYGVVKNTWSRMQKTM